jgi:predicted homoserine dehydrogenase-like protein
MGLRKRLEELEKTESPIRVGLVGAGQMGWGFVAQVEDIPGMEVVAAADIDPERALAALRASGRDPVEGPDGRVGRPAATQDPMDLSAGDKLGGIGSADYYGWLRVASEAAYMLPLGLAAGASVTQQVSRGQDIPRSAVRLPEDSFAVGLRRLQETSMNVAG